jgi:hypothetical protein
MEVLILFLAGLGFSFLPWIMLAESFSNEKDTREYYVEYE